MLTNGTRVISSLRTDGNKATHQFKTKHKEAWDDLKVVRALPPVLNPVILLFSQTRTTSSSNYKRKSIASKVSFTIANIQLDSSQKLQNLLVQEKSEYETLALAMHDETKVLTSQAKEQEISLEQLRQQYEEN